MPGCRIAGEIGVHERIPEPVLTATPVDEEVLNQEACDNHAHAIVHPPRRPQLAHARIHDRIAGLALLPGFQLVLTLVPFKRVELGLEIRFGQIREVVKQVVEDFIQKREVDRIGLVSYAGLAYTVCPLTTDYSWLLTNLERLETGQIQDGTAIGAAIASSVNRLRSSEAKSKVVILLTDGINNVTQINPLEAAEAAKTLGIKVYTIGAGKKGYARAPYARNAITGRIIFRNQKVEIDEDLLKDIAARTGGQYFRATDTQSLRDIYKQIDELEKTKIEESGYVEYKELFVYFLSVTLVFLLLNQLLSHFVFLQVP